MNLLSELQNLLPVIIMAVGGLITLMSGAFWKKSITANYYISILTVLAALAKYFTMLDKDVLLMGETVRISNATVIFSIIALIAVLLSMTAAKNYIVKQNINFTEFYSLILFSATGMLVMLTANDLLIVFVGLELMSLCFYVLAGFMRKKIKSNESSLKYFLLGSFMTGFLLFGMALIYGVTGSTNFQKIFSDPYFFRQPVYVIGTLLLTIGFLFKIGIFPFHLWIPDVYEGAPTTITGLMSTAGKIAAVGTIVPILMNGQLTQFKIIFAVLSVITMLLGNVTALSQSNLKRLLAFSSISSAGYIFVAVTALNEYTVKGIAFYLLAYTFMQIGAFIVVSLIERPGAGNDDSSSLIFLDDYKGLAKSNPILATVLSIFLLSLAGMPPLAGFWGKYYLFYAAIKANYIWLSVIAILMSVISLYYYLKVIVYMWFQEPEKEIGAIEVSSSYSIALTVGCILTFLLGIYPQLFFTIFKTTFK